MFLPDQSTIDLVDIQSVDDAAAALVAVSAAPSDAQYIVATVNGTLSAEQSLGALTTGLLKNTVASSVGTLSAAVAGTDYVAPGATTTSGLTMATARILGRSTASTGAIEEISIGSGLSLSGGTLSASGGGGSSTWGGITGTLSSQTDLQTALDAKQPLDADLTAIGGLSPTNDDIIQRKAGAWTNRTVAQFKTDLGLAAIATSGSASDLSAGTVPLARLSGITNTEIDNAAAIAYSKLNLTGAIVNGDLAGSIAATKLSAGNVDNTEFDYLNGLTGAIQTQIDGKAATTITLTAGAGLTGGGDLSANRSFAVGAGIGIAVNADDVALDINGLTAETTIASGDYVPIYDVSASAIRKMTRSDFLSGISGGSPGGSPTQIQYNNAGAFGGISGATSDGTNVTFGSGNLLATSPRVTTGINDANNNVMLAFSPAGSATQYLTIANNTATNAVSLTASSPTVAASAQAGTPFNLTASPAIAGNVNVGAAAGGNVTITAGNAARLTSGNANGGDINLLTGTGIGTGRAGVLFVPPGSSSGVPGIAFSSSGSVLNGIGVYSSGVNIITNGGTWLWVNAGGGVATGSTNPFAWSSSTDAAGTKDTYIRRNAAANIALGTTDAASPVAQTLSVQNVVGGTSNTAGANWTINASRGTGTGAGGSIIFQTAPAGGSGTTQNTLAAAFTVNGDGSVSLKSVTFANLPTQADGKLIYCSDCTAGSSPCTSGGSGALAVGQNSAWKCF